MRGTPQNTSGNKKKEFKESKTQSSSEEEESDEDDNKDSQDFATIMKNKITKARDVRNAPQSQK